MGKTATLRDVAREAGVAVTTASVVLRGDFSIALNPATRRRILDAAARLGYRRNLHASSLRTGRSNWIGLILSSFDTPIVLLKLQALEERLHAAGYRCLLRTTRGDEALEERYLQEFADSHVAGLVVADWPRPTLARSVRPLLERGVPLLSLEPFAGLEAEYDCVTVDRPAGGWLATRHLLELGHRRIGLLHGGRGETGLHQRFAGYDRALAEAGVTPDPQLDAKVAAHTFEGGYAAAQKLLGRKSRPTALFCQNDQVAIGAMRAALDLGLRIPQELSVVGFDDIPVAPFAAVPLTTVRQPVAEIAERAAARLAERIRSGAAAGLPPLMLALTPELVVRASTGPAPQAV